MHKKILLALIALAGVFAAQSDCLNQADPCFQANCYKVNGNWEYNSTSGAYDCMYDTSTYTNAQVQTAFATCLQQVATCEQGTNSGSTYTPSSNSSDKSSPSCCGTPLIFIGVICAGIYTYRRK